MDTDSPLVKLLTVISRDIFHSLALASGRCELALGGYESVLRGYDLPCGGNTQ